MRQAANDWRWCLRRFYSLLHSALWVSWWRRLRAALFFLSIRRNSMPTGGFCPGFRGTKFECVLFIEQKKEKKNMTSWIDNWEIVRTHYPFFFLNLDLIATWRLWRQCRLNPRFTVRYNRDQNLQERVRIRKSRFTNGRSGFDSRPWTMTA